MFFSSQEEMHQIKGTVFDRPPTTFDPVLSYRWNPGFRYVRVADGEIVCDLAPAINNEGFHWSKAASLQYALSLADWIIAKGIVAGGRGPD